MTKLMHIFKKFYISKQSAIMILLGILTGLSSTPLYFIFAAPFCISYLYTQITAQNNWKSAFKISFFFGFGYYLYLFHWIAFTVLEDPKFSFLLPIALVFVGVFPALYLAFSMSIFHKIEKKIENNIIKIVIFALAWILHERLRGSIILPFPWWQIGLSFSFSDKYLQALSVVSVNFFSFFVLCLYLIPAFFKSKSQKWQKITTIFLIITIHAVIYTYGHFRLKYKAEAKPLPFDISIVQTDFTQYTKYEEVDKGLDIYYEMIKKSIHNKASNDMLIILSETSIPYYVNLGKQPKFEYFSDLQNLLGKNDHIIFGSIGLDENDNYFNSAFLMGRNGITHHYNKVNLVPFGEYTPLLPIKLGFLPSMSAGKTREIFNINGVKISPLICYEVIFDKHIKKQKTDLIVNISNDGWFGNTIGPHQHMIHARISAIRNWRPLVRVANTGVSAYINKYGQIENSIPRHQNDFVIINK